MDRQHVNREAFENEANQYVQHPLLQRMLDGHFSVGDWYTYVSSSLDIDNETFISFLYDALQIAEAQNHQQLATVISDNIKEKEGKNSEGVVVFKNMHSVWRDTARKRIEAVLRSHGEYQRSGLVPNIQPYRDTLSEVLATENVFIVGGALAALEKLIACEYTIVYDALQRAFPILTDDDLLYFKNHGWHDDKEHFHSIFFTLSPDSLNFEEVQDVFRGVQYIVDGKRAMLDAILSACERTSVL